MGRKKANKVSKYKGIHWCVTDQRWRVSVSFDGRQHSVGNFKEEDDAYDWLDKFNQIVHPKNPIVSIKGEIWKDIFLNGTRYGVSNKGRIMSYNYRDTGREKVLSPAVNNFGYYTLRIQERTRFVHSLIILGFKGDSDLKVNHIDGNKLNNIPENLEYISNRANVCHNLILKGKRIGAYKRKKDGRWASGISIGDKKVWLGTFDTAQEASDRYLAALLEYGLIDDYNYITKMLKKRFD